MTDQPGAEAESGDSGPTENPPTAASPSEVARDESQPQTQTSGSFPSDHKQTNEPSVSAELAATQHSLDATKKALSDSLAKHEAYEALLSDALNKLSSARKEKGDAIEAAKKAAELAKVVDAALKEVNAIRGKLEKSETERKLALADRVLADSARIAAEKERQEAVEARKLAEARLEQFSKTHDSPTSLNGTESIPRLEMELQAAISDRDDAIRELEEANTERDLAWIERDEVKRTMEDLKSSWEKERKALTEKLDAANAKIAELETRLTAGLSPESTDPQPSLASPTTPSSPTIPNPFDSNMNVNAELAAAKVAHGSQIEALQIQLRALEKQRSELEAVTKKQGEERRALAAEVGRLSRQIGSLSKIRDSAKSLLPKPESSAQPRLAVESVLRSMKSMPNLSQASSITRSSSLTDASTKIVNGATDVDVETILATIGKVDAENVIKEVEEVLEKLGGKLSADAGHVTEKKGRWDRLFGRVKRG